jgi:hypothetical protein
MADEVKALEVKVTTSGDPAGAQQVEQALERVVNTAKRAGDGAQDAGRKTSELGNAAENTARKADQAAQATERQAIATDAQRQAAEQATGAAEKLNAEAERSAEAGEAAAAALDQTNEAAGESAESIDEVARRMAEANAKAAEWGNTIARLNNDQLLELEERLRESIKLLDAQGKSSDEARQKLEQLHSLRLDRLSQSMGETARRGSDLTKVATGVQKELRGIQQAGQGANQVLTGLSQGGIGGLITAGRGTATVIRTLATGALSGVLLPAIAAAGAAIFALNKKAEQLEKQIEKMFEEGARRSKEYAEAVERMRAESAKSLEAHVQQIERVAASYTDLIQRMDAAAARQAKVEQANVDAELAKVDRDEQAALAKAKTPEERQRISEAAQDRRTQIRDRADFAVIDTEVLQSRLQAEEATKAVAKAESELAAARVDAEKKAKDAEVARRVAVQTGKESGADSDAAKGARDSAKLADEAAKAAADNVEKLAKSVQSLVDTAEQRARDAEDTEKFIAPAKRAKKQSEVEGRQIQQGADTAARVKELEQEAQDAASRGDFAAQDKAVAERRRLILAKQQRDRAASEAAAPFSPNHLQRVPKDVQIAGEKGTPSINGEVPTAAPKPSSGGKITRGDRAIEVKSGDEGAVRAQQEKDAEAAKVAAQEIVATQANTQTLQQVNASLQELIGAFGKIATAQAHPTAAAVAAPSDAQPADTSEPGDAPAANAAPAPSREVADAARQASGEIAKATGEAVGAIKELGGTVAKGQHAMKREIQAQNRAMEKQDIRQKNARP